MREIRYICRMMRTLGRAAPSHPCGRGQETLPYLQPWSPLFRLAGKRQFSDERPPPDSKRSIKEHTVRVQIGLEEVKYSAGAMAQHIIADLTSRYGAGRLSTADSVVLLTPHLALDEGEYTYEPAPVVDFKFVDFKFRWTTSNEEVFEETVRLKDQKALKHLLDQFGAASFRPIGSKGLSFTTLEDINPDEVYNLVHAGRRSHALEVSHALDVLGKGEEDKTGEALLKVFGSQEGVVDAYLLPSMRTYKVEKHEPHYGEQEASQEWDAAAVIKRRHETELLLADHKRRLKATDIRKMALRLRTAVQRSRDPHGWRAYSVLAAYDRVRAVCSTKYISPSEKKKVRSASEVCNIPVLLENGSDLSIGSALLSSEDG